MTDRGVALTPRFLIGRVSRVKLLTFVLFLCVSPSTLPIALAQSTEAAEWPTGSFDQQRDAWQRNETKLTVDNAKDIRLLWKLKKDNKPMGMQSFREPLIVAGVPRRAPSRPWQFSPAAPMLSTQSTSIAARWCGKRSSSGRQTGPRSREGEGFICNNALTATPVVTPAGSGQRFLYVLTNDGYLHTMDPATGDETDAPIQMVPGVYGKPNGLNLVDNVVYTAMGQRCHGVPNEMYAVDLTTKEAFHTTPQAGILAPPGSPWVRMEPFISRPATGGLRRGRGKIVHQRPAYTSSGDTLTLKDYYTPSNHLG